MSEMVSANCKNCSDSVLRYK